MADLNRALNKLRKEQASNEVTSFEMLIVVGMLISMIWLLVDVVTEQFGYGWLVFSLVMSVNSIYGAIYYRLFRRRITSLSEIIIGLALAVISIYYILFRQDLKIYNPVSIYCGALVIIVMIIQQIDEIYPKKGIKKTQKSKNDKSNNTEVESYITASSIVILAYIAYASYTVTNHYMINAIAFITGLCGYISLIIKFNRKLVIVYKFIYFMLNIIIYTALMGISIVCMIWNVQQKVFIIFLLIILLVKLILTILYHYIDKKLATK